MTDKDLIIEEHLISQYSHESGSPVPTLISTADKMMDNWIIISKAQIMTVFKCSNINTKSSTILPSSHMLPYGT